MLSPSHRKIGETLVHKGYMTKQKVNVVLMRQEYGDSRLFGQIAISLNYLSEKDLRKCLSRNC